MKRLAVDICDISFPVNINRFANLHVTLQKKNVFFYRRHTNDACTIALINIVPLLNVIRFVTYFYRFFFLFSSSFLSPPPLPSPSTFLFNPRFILPLGLSGTFKYSLATRDVAWISLDLPVSSCLSLSLPRAPRLLLILSRANLSGLSWTFHLFPIFILIAFFVGRDPQLGNRCLILVSNRTNFLLLKKKKKS